MFVKRFSLLTVVLLLIAGLTACGKEKPKNTFEQIKSNKKLIVATEAAFPPYEFIENGKIVGYGPDILHEIAKNMDAKVEQLDVPFTGILTGLDEKKYDFVATSISVTPERQKQFGLTIPIGDNSTVVVKLKNNDDIKSLEDLNGKILGLTTGATGKKQIEEHDKKLKAEGKEGFLYKDLKFYQANTDKALDLKNGRIDVALYSRTMANLLIKEEPGTYEIVDSFGDKLYASWAVRKEDKELLEFLNAEILKLKKSGKLAELQEKWIGETFDLPDQLP